MYIFLRLYRCCLGVHHISRHVSGNVIAGHNRRCADRAGIDIVTSGSKLCTKERNESTDTCDAVSDYNDKEIEAGSRRFTKYGVLQDISDDHTDDLHDDPQNDGKCDIAAGFSSSCNSISFIDSAK